MTAREVVERDRSPLLILHGTLEAHFSALSEARQAMVLDAPVFAIEHGLTEAELLLLKTEIRATVRKGRLDRRAWLPLVVYATEIGYAYSGDEYWQTFEAKTPGWEALDRRPYLRDRFREFARRFNGAQPSGAWAEHFTIICWPITHAVLPRDLQRQLAQLLFEYRRALTSQQLRTPEELGKSLAARAWHGSARFRNFAQDTDLLGLVAASLLRGAGEQDPHLLDSTLTRIVHDLSSERQAKTWLHGAQSAASEIRAKGLGPTRWSTRAAAGGAQETRGVTADPLMFLRQVTEVWTAYLQMPDFSLLADRLPTLAEELRTKRAVISGASGAPLARGRLLHPGQVIKLDSWPVPNSQLVTLENAGAEPNALIADQSVLTPGPAWLFRVREKGLAREVRGKFVRPGGHYVLITARERPDGAPPWILPVASVIGSMTTLDVVIPDPLTASDLEALRAIGLGNVAEVEVRPAGLVPAHWDGEGRAEWLADEDPAVSISCERVVEQCIVTTDGTPRLVDWPVDTSSIFICLEQLSDGNHEVAVELRLAGGSTAKGIIEVAKRPPHTRPPAGSMREGLMILATPVTPTLPELWDDVATVEVRGPVGAHIDMSLALSDQGGKVLGTKHFTATLPLDAERWRHLARSKMREPFGRAYHRADRLVATASHPSLGSVSVAADRPFVPLRWVVRYDDDEAVVEVIDNSGVGSVKVSQRSFQEPDRAQEVPLDDGRLRMSKGGLVTARAGDHLASVIVPSTSVEGLSGMGLKISLGRWSRDAESLSRLVSLSHEWWAAESPSEFFARMWSDQVLARLTTTTTALIAGDRWMMLERHAPSRNWAALFDGMGKGPSHRSLASRLVSSGVAVADVDSAVHLLAEALRVDGPKSCVRGHDVELATFLLRLTTGPGSLPSVLEASELTGRLRLVLETPVLLKAARLLALVAETDSPSGSMEWVWP